MDAIRAIKGGVLGLVFLSVIFIALNQAWELSVSGLTANVSAKPEIIELITQDSKSDPEGPFRNWSVPALDLKAEAGVAAEVSLAGSEKILFDKNIYSPLPVASLTKLMTAVVALEKYNRGNIIKVTEQAASQEGGQTKILPGAEMAVNDLLHMMLIASNNKAAFALSEGMQQNDFVLLMNQKAAELGMKKTVFVEPTGLSPKNVSTAEDLLKLAEYILTKHPQISQISRIEAYEMPGYGLIKNTDELLGEVPDIFLGKTGFTIEAKGCLFLILKKQNDSNYLIYVILGAEERFTEMRKMIDWALAAYEWKT